jgi:membrane fusion protein, multidrug efflux system
MKTAIRIILGLIVLGGLIAAGSWKLKENKKTIEDSAKLTQERNTEMPVNTAIIGKKDITGGISVTGTYQPFKELAVISDAQGRITQLNVKDGDVVREGAVILAVDNDLLKNQLDIAKVNLKKTENDLTRLRNLLGDGGVTQQQIDDAENGIENMKANIRSLEKQISLTLMKAPITGTVSGKSIERGGVVAPGMKIMDLINVQRLKMKVYLTEDEVMQVKKGQRVELKADLYPTRGFVGVVNLIDVKADNSKRFLVEVELDNPGGSLKAGMDGTALFNAGRSMSILALPRASIVGSVRDAKVYVVQNGVAELRKVQLGNIYGEYVSILSGLSEGDEVVRAGQINLEDGMKVRVEK